MDIRSYIRLAALRPAIAGDLIPVTVVRSTREVWLAKDNIERGNYGREGSFLYTKT